MPQVKNIILSMNEIEQLGKQLTYACGQPWGIAEEVGWCLRWSSSLNLPTFNMLTKFVSSSWEDEASPIIQGITFSEIAGCENFKVKYFLLFLPFLHKIAVQNNKPYVCCIQESKIVIYPNGNLWFSSKEAYASIISDVGIMQGKLLPLDEDNPFIATANSVQLKSEHYSCEVAKADYDMITNIIFKSFAPDKEQWKADAG